MKAKCIKDYEGKKIKKGEILEVKNNESDDVELYGEKGLYKNGKLVCALNSTAFDKYFEILGGNTMTEKDLKLFDIVEHEDGTKQMVVSIHGVKGLSILKGNGNNFNEHGGGPFNKKWSYGEIVKVWRPKNRGWFGDFLRDGFKEEYFDLVWERESVKKMTVKEIQAELGYKIEIVE